MSKALLRVINFDEFGTLKLLSDQAYTKISTSEKKISPHQKYIFKTFKFQSMNSKYQKIILDTFQQVSCQKCQYLQCYKNYSLISFQSLLYPTFSMKFISSTTFETILNDTNLSKKWTALTAMKCLFAVAQGMFYLHGHLICHGNLCPSNIVVDAANQCYLSDFGFFSIKNLYYKSKDIFNNDYKDPKMFDDQPRFANDVYSFGVLMCQICLTFFLKSSQNLNEFTKKFNSNELGSLPPIFLELIPKCLNPSIAERPTFSDILDYFQKTKHIINSQRIDKLYDTFIASNYTFNLANLNDSFALNKLGGMYEKGKFFEKDHKKALNYYKKAALMNNSEAQNNYGVLLQDQSPNNKIGGEFLKKSAKQGNIHGMANYGVALMEGDGVEKNFEKALKYLKKSADLGYSYAQVNYGFTILNDKPTPQQVTEGLDYIKMAISQGDPDAYYTYAVLLYYGKVVPKNKRLSMEYFKTAADMGDVRAMIEYADGNIEGFGIPKDDEIALKYYTMAYDRGNLDVKTKIDELTAKKNENEKKSNKKSETRKTTSSSIDSNYFPEAEVKNEEKSISEQESDSSSTPEESIKSDLDTTLSFKKKTPKATKSSKTKPQSNAEANQPAKVTPKNRGKKQAKDKETPSENPNQSILNQIKPIYIGSSSSEIENVLEPKKSNEDKKPTIKKEEPSIEMELDLSSTSEESSMDNKTITDILISNSDSESTTKTQTIQKTETTPLNTEKNQQQPQQSPQKKTPKERKILNQKLTPLNLEQKAEEIASKQSPRSKKTDKSKQESDLETSSYSELESDSSQSSTIASPNKAQKNDSNTIKTPTKQTQEQQKTNKSFSLLQMDSDSDTSISPTTIATPPKPTLQPSSIATTQRHPNTTKVDSSSETSTTTTTKKNQENKEQQQQQTKTKIDIQSTNLSSNPDELIKKGDLLRKQGNLEEALQCYERAADCGYQDAYFKCVQVCPAFDKKLKYFETALQKKVPGSFNELRKSIMKHLAGNTNTDKFMKFAQYFEKIEDFADAARLYRRAKDTLNFSICYEKAKENISDIQDGQQQFHFAQLLESKKEYKLAISMYQKAVQNGVPQAEQSMNELKIKMNQVESFS